MREINGRTKVCGLLGYPVEHTLSPLIHNTLAQALGVNLVYVPFCVEPGRIGEAVRGACALALANTLGLVCDPVGGLVEVPCISRNVMGAVNALSCAEMALSGVESRIPCDEVIDAMGAVGALLPASLRETGQGGLAATPTGRRYAEEAGR